MFDLKIFEAAHVEEQWRILTNNYGGVKLIYSKFWSCIWYEHHFRYAL